MKITDWPIAERPREKIVRQGASSLTDAEVLAALLGSGLPGASALDIARQAIADHGGLGNLLLADLSKFTQSAGLGVAKYTLLQASLELATRFHSAKLKQCCVFNHASDVEQYLTLQMRGFQQEVFALLMLSSQHHLLAFRPMFFGTINAAAVYPREIVRQAIADNAAAVILVHNHPSGVAEPSQADIRITQHITQALRLIDVEVLDHFVVARTNTVSLAQRGLL